MLIRCEWTCISFWINNNPIVLVTLWKVHIAYLSLTSKSKLLMLKLTLEVSNMGLYPLL